jgi:hypothetical protein
MRGENRWAPAERNDDDDAYERCTPIREPEVAKRVPLLLPVLLKCAALPNWAWSCVLPELPE